MFKKSFSLLLVFTLLASFSLTGCLRTKGTTGGSTSNEAITLTFYGLFDTESVYQSLIQSYENQNPNVNIIYKTFTNSEEYLDLIVNELAEGEGPDIFMMHNTWFPKHYKKLTPAPESIVTPDVFRSLFVEITGDELIIPDEEGTEQIWGLPLYVDTLALFYNKEHYEEAVPSRGRPASTWEGIQDDVTLLTREDNSFERFERAGIALGRGDNILRAFEIVLMMMLQYKVDFYNEDLTKALFDNDENAVAAWDLYTSFGLPSKKNYSWNAALADADTSEKEITTFASGKVSMIMGYSYTYEAILDEISRLKAEGENTIDINDIKIQETPQVYDPETTSETREAYASYFAPVVSRTSEYSEEAWTFLAHLVDEENLSLLNEQTNRPSALRSLISEEMNDPIYGVFAAQVGYAESIPMADPEAYKSIFLDGIESILNTARSEEVLREIADQIQDLIPAEGIKPSYVAEPD